MFYRHLLLRSKTFCKFLQTIKRKFGWEYVVIRDLGKNYPGFLRVRKSGDDRYIKYRKREHLIGQCRALVWYSIPDTTVFIAPVELLRTKKTTKEGE